VSGLSKAVEPFSGAADHGSHGRAATRVPRPTAMVSKSVMCGYCPTPAGRLTPNAIKMGT
jgi:hypothetical protein